MEGFQVLWVIGIMCRMSINKSYTLMQIIYIWAMSQYLPNGEFEKLPFNPCNLNIDQLVEDLIEIPDDNENGFFIQCNLQNPIVIKEKTKNFPLCPYQTKADPELFKLFMNSVNQLNYKPTQKLVCDLTNKQKNDTLQDVQV